MLRRCVIGLICATVLSACSGMHSATKSATASGEFGNQCVTALAMGKHYQTDCSINAAGPDGKTYCFGNDEAKQMFMKDPSGTIGKAKQFMAANAEFGGMCTTGLAMGKKIPTDCSISMVGADGKTYCFGNEEAKQMYMKDPAGITQKARDFYSKG